MNIGTLLRKLSVPGLFASVRLRLLALVLISFLPALALFLYSAEEERDKATDSAHREALALTQFASDRQEQLIAQTRQLLSFVVKQPFVQLGNALTCSSYLAELTKEYPQYTGIVVANLNGDLYCSSSTLPSPINVSSQPDFQNVVQTYEFTVGDYQIDKASGKATLSLGYPVFNENNELRAVAFALVDLSWLSGLAVNANLPPDSIVSVIDANGIILARYPDPERWVGRSILHKPLADAIFASDGPGTADIPSPTGVARLYGFNALAGEPHAGDVYIAVGISKAVAYGPAEQALRRNLIGLSIAAAIAIAIVWFGVEMFIVNQVRSLVRATLRFASGDLGFRIRPKHNSGEFGQLAIAFDQMARQLEERESHRKQLDEERARRIRSEIMLTEIQHRVKNSLQIAASLISLQARRVNDINSRAALQESEERIHAIAGIYTKLQIKDGAALVDFVPYLRDILPAMVRAQANSNGVALQVTGDNILLDSEKAVPCALLVNELVTNSIKHAFPDRKSGVIKVHVHRLHDQKVALLVSDNGIGLPENLELHSAQTLGLKLVNTLTDQLHGEITVERGQGTAFLIQFKAPENNKP
jgi:two-component sensor histidine kinase